MNCCVRSFSILAGLSPLYSAARWRGSGGGSTSSGARCGRFGAFRRRGIGKSAGLRVEPSHGGVAGDADWYRRRCCPRRTIGRKPAASASHHQHAGGGNLLGLRMMAIRRDWRLPGALGTDETGRPYGYLGDGRGALPIWSLKRFDRFARSRRQPPTTRLPFDAQRGSRKAIPSLKTFIHMIFKG